MFRRQSEGNLLPLTADPAAPVSQDGTIRPLSAFPTGGRGSGGRILAQGAVTLSDDGRFLLTVSPGSNEVSCFLVTPSGLQLASKVSSGGVLPVSVTVYGDLVYVVNAVSYGLPPVTPGLDGVGKGRIVGFRIDPNGVLAPLVESGRDLSTSNSWPAQISFSPDGRLLVITEIIANRITIFPVDEDGATGEMIENESAGRGPFGFAYNSRGFLVVSDSGSIFADDSTVSSYEVSAAGKITVVSAAVPTNQAAACWTANTPDARYVYTSNTTSGTITGFSVSQGGRLTILNPNGRTAFTGALSGPADIVISANGQFLDVLAQGSQTILTFRIGGDGSLTLLSSVGNLPPLAIGLAIGTDM
ncbi:MAG: lactonase family protein [Pseudonocardiaceae bacterium]